MEGCPPKKRAASTKSTATRLCDFVEASLSRVLRDREGILVFKLSHHLEDIPYSMLVLNMVKSGIMDTARKITVEVPGELLKKAQRASGAGVTQTIRAGLQLVAASLAYARLRQLRGKVRFSRTAAELKADR